MAIMKCEECGGDVSTKAATCPKCGAPAPTDADYEMLQSRLKKEQEEHEAEKRRQKEKREKKRLEEERKKRKKRNPNAAKRRSAKRKNAVKRKLSISRNGKYALSLSVSWLRAWCLCLFFPHGKRKI